MKLVWHHPGMRQKDWVRFVFKEVLTGEIEDPGFSCFEDNSIHVVSMIYHPLQKLDSYFEECRKRCNNIVLYHAGDEWFSGGCAPYRNFDNVVRELPSFFTRSEGIACIPLGCPNINNSEGIGKSASERQIYWSFAGEIRNTRIEMIDKFIDIPGGKLIDTNHERGLTPSDYQALLRESVFAPCGMGNVITETWRVYEAIESGAIPLVEKRLTLDYYRNLLGAHPLPTFSSWGAAAQFAKRCRGDKKTLDSMQSEIVNWWASYKEELVDHISKMLEKSHNKEMTDFGRNIVNTNVFVHEALRFSELLRHQSYKNIIRRSAHPLKPLRRLALGLRRKDER